MPSSGRSGSSRTLVMVFGVLVLIALLIGGAVAVSAYRDQSPDDNSAEAGFLRDMSVHHDQAVAMSVIIRDRSDDEQIKAMATDIAFSQTSQIGTMNGFLLFWDLNPSGEESPMAWMGHEVEGRMPGMASPEQIEQLRTLPVEEAETLFMQLMNRHHIAGVDMAEAIIERTDHEDLIEMAEAMVRVQSAEIEIMNQLLEERGAEPVTRDNMNALFDATPAADHEDH